MSFPLKVALMQGEKSKIYFRDGQRIEQHNTSAEHNHEETALLLGQTAVRKPLKVSQ
jgi:hypothetical protein